MPESSLRSISCRVWPATNVPEQMKVAFQPAARAASIASVVPPSWAADIRQGTAKARAAAAGLAALRPACDRVRLPGAGDLAIAEKPDTATGEPATADVEPADLAPDLTEEPAALPEAETPTVDRDAPVPED